MRTCWTAEASSGKPGRCPLTHNACGPCVGCAQAREAVPPAVEEEHRHRTEGLPRIAYCCCSSSPTKSFSANDAVCRLYPGFRFAVELYVLIHTGTTGPKGGTTLQRRRQILCHPQHMKPARRPMLPTPFILGTAALRAKSKEDFAVRVAARPKSARLSPTLVPPVSLKISPVRSREL